jgi:hypothetical protein
VRGVTHPTPAYSIAIALLGAIGVPIALIAISVAIKGLREPDASILRQEAEARRRTAAALDDAATAETLKAEMEAFVALRARRLEIERRRIELRRDADRLVNSHKALGAAERQLELEQTQLDPATTRVLDDVLNLYGEGYARIYPYFQGLERMVSMLLPGVGEVLRESFGDFMQRLERRRLRRLARIAPSALDDGTRSTEGSKKTDD